MIAFLARHEWTLLTTSAVVRTVVLVFAAALLMSSWLGAERSSREQRIHASFAARASAPPPSSMRADAIANERGWLALLPPAGLASLAAGQGDVYPGYIKVTARNLDALVTGDQIEHPLAVASGQFDAAFVILFLYPLLIFAVSFDLTATERDRGTLRMVLSQPVRLADLIAGKLIARWLLLAVPAIVIPIAMVIVKGASPDAFALPLALWAIAVAAYGLIWHGLALIVNARGWNAATNALVLAGIWLLFAIVGPSTINLVIAVRYPMPSRVEAAVQARAATTDAAVQGSRDLGQFLQDHPTSANVGREGMRQFARLQAARDQQLADRLHAVDSAFDAQLARQQRLAGLLSVLSPSMIAQQVLLEIAGTGTSRFNAFEAAAAQFQQQWKTYFEPLVLDAATLTASEIAASPKFAYAEPPFASTASRVAPSIALMIGAGVALIWIGFRRYRGYSL